MSPGEQSTSPNFHLQNRIHHCEARSRNGRVAIREGKGKGKEPASSNRQTKKKVFSREAPQPKAPLSIEIDDVPAERRSLRSAKSNVQNEGLPDDCEVKVLGGGRSKRSNINKGTKRKQSRRKVLRRNVKSTQGSSDRSAMRNHSWSKKTRRSMKREVKADADPSYSPKITRKEFTPRVGRSRECVQTRSHARTAATHSPRDPTFRAAIIEAYRHEILRLVSNEHKHC